MVPIKREPLTAFVSDTVAVLGRSWLLSAIRFYIQPYSREESIGEKRGVKRSLYRVFHKDSMKIVRDFIIEETSVNKNEYVGPFFFSSSSSFTFSLLLLLSRHSHLSSSLKCISIASDLKV